MVTDNYLTKVKWVSGKMMSVSCVGSDSRIIVTKAELLDLQNLIGQFIKDYTHEFEVQSDVAPNWE